MTSPRRTTQILAGAAVVLALTGATVGVSSSAASSAAGPAIGLSATTQAGIATRGGTFVAVDTSKVRAITETAALGAIGNRADFVTAGKEPDEAGLGLYSDPGTTPVKADGSFESSTFRDRLVWMFVYRNVRVRMVGSQPGATTGGSGALGASATNLVITVDAVTGTPLGGWSVGNE